MAVDNLGNIVWICPVLPGTSADVKIWDKYGPQRTKGCFMEFEVGAHDGAYKGRLHSHVPFIGRKTLTMRQKTYNDVHGYYRAQVEHLFAHLWSWRVVCDIWLGSHQDLHANTRILLHTRGGTRTFALFTVHVAKAEKVSTLWPMGAHSFFHLDRGRGP